VAFRLHEGTNLTMAVGQLSECVTKGRDLASSSGGEDEGHHLNRYLTWAGATEAQLRNVFTDLAILHHLRTTAYWAIRNALFQPFRVTQLINTEATEQASWLEALTYQLQALDRRLDAAPGQAMVLDTNVLLHYEPPWEVAWPTVVRQDEVRLIVPLRVIEELDEKKYTSRADLADRARRLLSRLWGSLGESAGAPVPLRENVTIEVPVEEGRRVRASDADEEILESCEQLRNVGRPAILVTGDTGMSLRAKARRLEVIPMPEKYLRSREPPAGRAAAV
jgi:hypothetical protein